MATDAELPTYRFVAGWLLIIVILVAANKTRLGHVIIYYALLLMILLILVTEYQQISPLLQVQSIGQLNAPINIGTGTPGVQKSGRGGLVYG